MAYLKKTGGFLLVLLAMLLLSCSAFAAGKIETDRDVQFTVQFRDGSKPIPGSTFDIFRIADADEFAAMSLTEEFEPYKLSVSGLANLELMDQDGWKALADTLKSVVLRDGIQPGKKGMTSAEGIVSFTLKPGLYLVVGHSATTDDFCTYLPQPFLAFLPGMDAENNVWTYQVVASPKYAKDIGNIDDRLITRKVLKSWDDAGFEYVRPAEISVSLLCDGKVYDTVKLNAGNNWRWAWDNLDAGHEWDITEATPENYSASVSRTGITFVLRNKYIAPISDTDLYVQKKITGTGTVAPGSFRFILTADDPSYPMPEGSIGTIRDVTLYNYGFVSFGKIQFSAPGTYTYKAYEVNTGLANYSYDPTIYYIAYTVSENSGVLTISRSIRNAAGVAVPGIVFTNRYNGYPVLPQTGQTWWPIPLAFAMGVMLVLSSLLRRKRKSGEKIATLLLVAGILSAAGGTTGIAVNKWQDHHAGKVSERIAETVSGQIQAAVPPQSAAISFFEADAQETDYPDYMLDPDMKMPVKHVDGGDYVGVLEIPALGKSFALYDEWDYEKLQSSPCRYSGSAYRDDLVICAHNYEEHFGKIKDLSYGDEISLTDMDGNLFRYRIGEIELLRPDQVEDMQESDWDLTLFTCTLGGGSRVTVRCEKV